MVREDPSGGGDEPSESSVAKGELTNMRLLESRLPLTPEGKEELAVEIACLEQIRRDILNEAKNAPESAGSSPLCELAAVDGEISRLRQVLAQGTLTGQTGLVVAVGSEVTVVDEGGEKTFTIGGPLAANPRFGCVSYESPFARAVLGRELGETVEVSSADGRRWLKIVAIRRGRPRANLNQGGPLDS